MVNVVGCQCVGPKTRIAAVTRTSQAIYVLAAAVSVHDTLPVWVRATYVAMLVRICCGLRQPILSS